MLMSQCGALLESPGGSRLASPGAVVGLSPASSPALCGWRICETRDPTVGTGCGESCHHPPSLSDTPPTLLPESQKTELCAWFWIGGWGVLCELFKGFITASWGFAFLSISLLRIPLPPSSLALCRSQYPCSSILKGAFLTYFGHIKGRKGEIYMKWYRWVTNSCISVP